MMEQPHTGAATALRARLARECLLTARQWLSGIYVVIPEGVFPVFNPPSWSVDAPLPDHSFGFYPYGYDD